MDDAITTTPLTTTLPTFGTITNSMLKVVLTEGSFYKITSLRSKTAPMVTYGLFRGYVSLGALSAIAIELDPKYHRRDAHKLRLIPTHVILSIDIIKQVETKKVDEEKISPYLG